MQLLTPLFLLALPLVAVPVILHFYKGRDPETIDWGAMHFLMDAVSEGRRWERLEELLLMILRVAAVALLVFALARPLVNGSWLGARPTREVVLIADDSLSTAARSGDENAFETIRRDARELIGQLGADDHVQLMAAAGGGRWLTADAVRATAAGKDRLRDVIDAMAPTQGRADMLACLESAARVPAPEESRQVTSRAVYVVADGQQLSWRLDARDAWNSFGRALKDRSLPLTVHASAAAPSDARDNLALGPVAAARSVVRAGEAVRVECEVANLSDTARDGLTVEWRLGDRVLETSKVRRVRPGESSKVTARIALDETGVHAIECRLAAEDSLDLDNHAWYVLEVADTIPVLLVTAPAEEREAQRLPDAQLISAALGYRDGEPQRWHSVFEPRAVRAAAMADERLSDYVAVVVTDVDGLSADSVLALETYVAAGGGLLIAPDERVTPESFAIRWHDGGEGLSPLALDELVAAPPGEEGALHAHPPARDHPATRELANTTQLDIDKLRVRRHWQFESPREGQEASVLLESGSGDPLAVENYYGQGRVIVMALPLGMEWSNLPLLKAYVVMIQDWLDYLSTPARARHNLAPGAPLVARVPAGGASAKLMLPGGGEEELTLWRGDDDPLLRYTGATLPGLYRVAFETGGQELPFSVPRGLEESELKPLTDADRAQLREWSGVAFSPELDAEPAAEAQGVPREPFWWTLLCALALLLIAELLLAARVSSRRWAPASAAA